MRIEGFKLVAFRSYEGFEINEWDGAIVVEQ